MKTVLTGFTVSFSLVAGIAQASPVNSPEPKTRAEVVAELREARALGLISDGELDYPTLKSEPLNSKSRQEVLAELETAHEAGTLSYGELDYPPETRSSSSVTRAQVQAELFEYKAAGRSEEHTSDIQSLMRISYAFTCLKKNTQLLKITQKIMK